MHGYYSEQARTATTTCDSRFIDEDRMNRLTSSFSILAHSVWKRPQGMWWSSCLHTQFRTAKTAGFTMSGMGMWRSVWSLVLNWVNATSPPCRSLVTLYYALASWTWAPVALFITVYTISTMLFVPLCPFSSSTKTESMSRTVSVSCRLFTSFEGMQASHLTISSFSRCQSVF